jgi:hypothetical protein
MRITLALRLVAILVLSMALGGQTQNRDVVLSVNGPRPLSDAATQLELKFQTSISYEDVALVYSGDYARALDTDWGREYAERGDSRFKLNNPIASRGGSLEIHFEIDPATGMPVAPVSQILRGMLDQHKARGNPGQFKLLVIGSRFVIVPTTKRDDKGALIPERSPLDSLISFPVAKRTGVETLRMICEAVTSASGRMVGDSEGKLFLQTVVEIGADRETARDVLVRTLDGLRWADGRSFPPIPKMSWHLLYGPSRLMTSTPSLADSSYALNIRSIQ